MDTSNNTTPEDQDRPLSNESQKEIHQIAKKRGHLKIIMGAAPGVGKTYRMLQEAQNLKKLGIDVVVGYFESHDRLETIALLDGLEVIPRKQIDYKGVKLEEMDTEAIIKREPHTAVIDELAHTNVSGSKNAKRYEDVEEILQAGIHVISTMNVQHLESLNDIVSRITGVQVNERLPDSIVEQADEVVLVDISVEELQERLKKGKIYAKEKIEQSLNHFFKKGNLVALRELALREVANNVEDQAEKDLVFCPIEPTGVHERILVCISTHPNSQRLIRRGYRIANRLNGELIVLFVKRKDKQCPKEYLETLEKHKELTKMLEGEYIEIEAPNIMEAVVQEAKKQKITQIIIGESLKEPGFWNSLKPPLPYQILQRLNNIDVYIIGMHRQ